MEDGQNSSVFDKLTDTRLNPGRERAAKGAGYLGASGEFSRANLHTPSLMPPPSRGGCPVLYQRAGSNDGGKGFPTPLSPTGPRPGSVGRRHLIANCRSDSPVRLNDNGLASPSRMFDRLTADPPSHKLRFSSDGRIRAPEGRTLPPAQVPAAENVVRS